MDNFIYSLNATMPIFLIIVVGYVLRQIGMIHEEFANDANKFVYKITLPSMLFMEMLSCDIRHTFDGKYVLYCALATISCIALVWILARLLIKDKSIIGEFVQGSYRGSAAILGIALVENISGSVAMAPLMILGSVPLYNIFAVIVLIFEEGTKDAATENALQNKKRKQEKIRNAILGICKNPIILSILLGMAGSYAGLTLPTILDRTATKVGSLTTPLALIVIGAGFEGRKAIKMIWPTIAATSIKLIIQPLVFLPVAVKLGFSSEQIAAALVMLGAPTTATSYIMSRNLGHEGTLSSSIVVMTTLLSSVTITLWIFILRSFV